MRKLLTLFSLLAVLLVTGCSTVEGIGKDLQSIGGTIEKEAKDEKAK